MVDVVTKLELQKDEARFAEEQHRRMIASLIVGGLITCGLIFVIFAESFGLSYARFVATAQRGYLVPDEVQAAVNTCRILGVMSFLGGLAERIVLVIQHSRST